MTKSTNDRRQTTEAKLIIETSAEEKIVSKSESENQTTNVKPQTANTKLAALDKIRSQVRGNGNQQTDVVTKPIELEELQQAWNEYTIQLKERKNSAWQGFEMAELRVQDKNNFIAIVSSNIDLRFIEQEGLKVSQFLRKKLQNNELQFLIVMQENKEQKTTETPLTSREQYQKMVELYPLIKELKERLRLELDY